MMFSPLPGAVCLLTVLQRFEEARFGAAYWVMNAGWDTGRQSFKQESITVGTNVLGSGIRRGQGG
jgi:hypothetical protein